jgi:hypothetical protein
MSPFLLFRISIPQFHAVPFFFATVNLQLKTEISWKNEALPVDEYINCLNRIYCFVEKSSLSV